MDPKTAPRKIDCGPEQAPVVRKKPLAKKPRTEVVVQMGPFTDGNVSTPDSFENLSGPKELLIKPDTGEIGPFDPAKPVPENVIRKYITVQAQDNDVPNDLPKSGSGDYILRELPSIAVLDGDPNNEVVTRVEYVRESYSTSTLTTEERDPLIQEECPPCDCEEPGIVEPPVCEEAVKCEEPPDANNDMASTPQNTAVTIDVLKNDSGCEPLCISSAHADNGLVEIVEGKLVYTPQNGFHGNDVINYTISDHGCLTDDASVFVTVNKDTTPPAPVVEAPKCEAPVVDECANADSDCSKPADQCEAVVEMECEPNSKYESSDSPKCYEEGLTESVKDTLKESIFERTESLLDEIFNRTTNVMEKVESTRSAWTEALDSSWSKSGAVASASEDMAVVA